MAGLASREHRVALLQDVASGVVPAQMKHAWLGFFMYVVCVLKGKSDYFVMGHLLVLQASS